MPGDTPEDVLAHVRTLTGDLPVTASLAPESRDASNVSSWNDPFFDHVSASVRTVFADISPIVAPYLMTGGTDGRHYETVSNRIYRFLPLVVTPAEGMPFHATDESIRVEDYRRLVLFYATLLESVDSEAP